MSRQEPDEARHAGREQPDKESDDISRGDMSFLVGVPGTPGSQAAFDAGRLQDGLQGEGASRRASGGHGAGRQTGIAAWETAGRGGQGGDGKDDLDGRSNIDEGTTGQDAAPGEGVDGIQLGQDQLGEIQEGQEGVESEEGQVSEIEQIVRERDEYLDLARRTQADYENYRKRMMRQQAEASTRSVQDLVAKLLPVLDAFSIAQIHMGDDLELDPDTKALMQSGSMLSDILASEGLERIDRVGVVFDPNFHDAIEHVAGQPGSETTVVEVLRAGYGWKGKVLRPAMVRVVG
ncbi:MAG: nucleotide exchange factor GrpE [Actinobacteria bacterium]|nr:nucleotide exchange factor GrpE [Actinomycetota bacterium]MCL5447527.1 nucleotide exchange factor GrpE [Actinomycetota bacterium]